MASAEGREAALRTAWRDTAADLRQAADDLRGVYGTTRKRLAALPGARRGPSDSRYCTE